MRLARIHPRTARWIGTAICGAAIVLLVASIVLSYVDRSRPVPPGDGTWNVGTTVNRLAAIGVAILGIVIVAKRPLNSIGWLFVAAASSLAVGYFGNIYAVHSLVAMPGSVPAGRLAAFLSSVAYSVPTSMLLLLLFLFPTGRALSPRWRRVIQALLLVFAMYVLLSFVESALTWNSPFVTPSSGASSVVGEVLLAATAVGYLMGLILAIVCVVMRYRRSGGDERQQLKWFTFASSIVVITFAVSSLAALVAPSLGNSNLLWCFQGASLIFLWVAIGIAMLKYRLYDIDVVIRKTAVFGLLAAFITAVYALIVAVSTDLFRASTAGSFAAAATLAILFAPARERARRVADRLVYGRRATPYEVLADFSDRVGESYASEDVLHRMALVLKEGIGASGARVLLRVGVEQHEAAAVGETGTETVVPVLHQGEELGALAVSMPANDPMDPAKRALVEDLASQAGLVLRNVALIEDLRASRQRLVAAQDEERRKLERNIHDGAQQQLVALAVKANLAKGLATRDPAKTEEILGQLGAEVQEALENLRDLARGIYPPLLADKGLAVALESQARKSSVLVSVEANGIGRYPQEIEAAVYFCSLEALQNVAKYANASSAAVILAQTDGHLSFEVRDDGQGFDPDVTGYGTGLQGIADRLAALGGSLEVSSTAGEGTVVSGSLPVAAAPIPATPEP
jgi:signal transduction histidine kinase